MVKKIHQKILQVLTHFYSARTLRNRFASLLSQPMYNQVVVVVVVL